MIFEFIITHQPREDEPIDGILRERLREALEANLNDVEEDALSQMVHLNFEREQQRAGDDKRLAVLGFSLVLPDETASVREVVDEFTDALIADPIEHAVKCEDPLVRTELAERAEELFVLEMKLRRVLSIIYLHAYPGIDPYNLLAEETVQPISKDKLQKDQMKAMAENQFFHLTFGQYIGLNQRPAIKDLVSLIQNEETYEAFRAELVRKPVEHENDAGFVSSLKDRMDAVEKMRNAVAHNRRPPRKATNDYFNALPLLNQALDDYLSALAAKWADSLGNNEMAWEMAARKAVERTFDTAHWNEDMRTITLQDPDEPRGKEIVANQEALISYLERVAAIAFYANCPREDGEFLFHCEESDIVESVLVGHYERIAEFFASA